MLVAFQTKYATALFWRATLRKGMANALRKTLCECMLHITEQMSVKDECTGLLGKAL